MTWKEFCFGKGQTKFLILALPLNLSEPQRLHSAVGITISSGYDYAVE